MINVVNIYTAPFDENRALGREAGCSQLKFSILFR